MIKDEAIAWLEELEIYFQLKTIMSKEDIEVQAYTQNALNAKKVAELIRRLYDKSQ